MEQPRFGMDREREIQYLDPTPFRDRLEHELRKLGATSEKRAICITTVGQWLFRSKAKLTATLLSDQRFVLSNLGSLDASVHVVSQTSPTLADSALTPRNGVFAEAPSMKSFPSAPLAVFTLDDCAFSASASARGTGLNAVEVQDHLGRDDGSSSEHADNSVKRPLKASDKRRKIRKVIPPAFCFILALRHSSIPVSDSQRQRSAFADS